VGKQTSATPAPLYTQHISEELQGKIRASKHYRVLPDRSGPDLGPSYHAGMIECNLRIDFSNDGSIYNVEWNNKVLTPLAKDTK
jgi:hypothetical protein